MAMAQEMDGAAGFCFFAKTSADVCSAIIDRNNPQAASVLERHLRRIDDPRLRRALEAALGEGSAPPKPTIPNRSNRDDLWKGLRQR